LVHPGVPIALIYERFVGRFIAASTMGAVK
jgi:hypothetical protein